MSRRGKDINKDEEGLWELVTADIAPLKGRKKATAPAKPPAGAQPAKPVGVMVAPRPPARVKAPAAKGRDIDRRTEQKLVRGQMEIDAVIDLHGHGQAAAHESFLRFVQEAYRRGYRCILVITGKGKNNTGILRTRVPEWANDPPLRDIVLRVTHARQEDGGMGAFYVLLRRRRD